MEILRRDAAMTRWKQYWDQMQHEWFKLEVFQDYSGEDDRPSLQAYIDGDPERGLALIRQEIRQSAWRTECELSSQLRSERAEGLQKYNQGVTLRRVRIVETPPTPYTAWELEYFKHFSILNHEQIFLVDKNDLGDISLPDGDMMIFDNQRVVVNTYDETMRMKEQTFYTENDSVAGFLALKGSLLERALPL